jgi:nitric oxide reductase subunit C
MGMVSPANRVRSLRRRFIAAALLACLALTLAACGGAKTAGGAEAAAVPTPTRDPVLAAGQKVFVAHCGACHSAEPGSTIVGPSLAHLAETGGTRVDGLDARAYVYNSIMRPSDYLAEGFGDLMPQDLARKLTGEELDSVVAYVLSLN